MKTIKIIISILVFIATFCFTMTVVKTIEEARDEINRDKAYEIVYNAQIGDDNIHAFMWGFKINNKHWEIHYLNNDEYKIYLVDVKAKEYQVLQKE